MTLDPMPGTERLARTLVTSLTWLRPWQREDAIIRLTRAFQSAWIDEMRRQTSEESHAK